MIRTLFVPLFVLALQAAFISVATAQGRDPLLLHREVVPLAEGPNTVDLLGQGRPGLVTKGFFNNYNAHSFEYITFYVTYADSESDRPRWDVVPFITDSRLDLGFSTHQGADCVLRDLRVLKQLAPPPTAVIVVQAERDMGASYADSQFVNFFLYEFRTNTAMTPGKPGIYFERTRAIRSRRAYCDVEDAFRNELGLGSGVR